MLAGDLKQRLNDFEGALASYQSAFEAQRRLPPDRGDFIRFHMSCANALLCQSNPEAANVHYRAALSQMEGLRCDGLGQGEVRSEMGIHSTLGFGFFNFTSVRRCFLQLLLKDFQNAKVGALADLGSRKQPLNDYNLMGFCLPHIHMYLGEKSQAEELYRRYKGRILHNGSTWEEAVAEDFATFRKLGMEHPQMKEIEALLEIAPTVKKKPVNPTNRVEQAEGITP
jgi:tetratricopeptide (TPR) repeat protein